MVYTLVVQDTGCTPYIVPSFYNMFGTLILLKKVLIYKYDPTPQYTPPVDVYLYSCTANNLQPRSPYNHQPFTSRWYMALNFLLDAGM